jgi:small subunit ribosomal protein S5
MEKEKKEFEEKVVEVARVSRTVKGGRRMRFRALVAIGNHKGKVGIGLGKSNEVAGAVQKAVTEAHKFLIDVPIVNDTIPHEIKLKYGSAIVFLKPAAPGTSVIAGNSVRSVVELAGIKNILTKSFGSSNKINNVRATYYALKSLRMIENKKNVNNDPKQVEIKDKKIDIKEKDEIKSNSTKK